MLKSLSAVAVAVMLSAPSIAADPAINWNSTPQTSPAPQATIRFARQGGIDNWTVVDEKTVYVQDRQRQWYRADLMGHCIGLRFAQHDHAGVAFGSLHLVLCRHEVDRLVARPAVERARPVQGDVVELERGGIGLFRVVGAGDGGEGEAKAEQGAHGGVQRERGTSQKVRAARPLTPRSSVFWLQALLSR